MVQKEPLENLYEECHRRFYYSDGELIRKITTSSRAKKGSSPTHINNSGYLMVCVNAKQYLVHRIIYLMHHGTLPDMIDHIDRNKLNNRIENLREADKEVNSWNRDLQRNNTSGYRGVSWSKVSEKWHSYIKIKGKRIHLGLFDDKEEAHIKYEEARIKFGTNESSTTT